MITFGKISIPSQPTLTGRQLINVEIFYNSEKYDWMVYTPFCNGQLLMDYLNTNAFIYENDIVTKEAIWAVTPRTKEIDDGMGNIIVVPVLKSEIVKPTIPDSEELNYNLAADVQAIKRLLYSLSDSIISNPNVTQQQLNDLAVVYTSYKLNYAYTTGDVFSYENKLYEVLQSHTSQIDWTPPTATSLYKVKTPEGTIAEWVQPLGSTDAYLINDLVTYGGVTWRNDVNYNVWVPGVYGWTDISTTTTTTTSSTTTTTTTAAVSTTTTTTVNLYPEWVQPLGAQDAYPLDALVSHNGFHWKSIVAANVWEPGVYGWIQV